MKFTHSTNKGRIVYIRLKHEFSIKDATRIIRNLDPMVEEAPDYIDFSRESVALLRRLIAAFLRVSIKKPDDLLTFSFIIVDVVEALYASARKIGTSVGDSVRDVFGNVLGLVKPK